MESETDIKLVAKIKPCYTWPFVPYEGIDKFVKTLGPNARIFSHRIASDQKSEPETLAEGYRYQIDENNSQRNPIYLASVNIELAEDTQLKLHAIFRDLVRFYGYANSLVKNIEEEYENLYKLSDEWPMLSIKLQGTDYPLAGKLFDHVVNYFEK